MTQELQHDINTTTSGSFNLGEQNRGSQQRNHSTLRRTQTTSSDRKHQNHKRQTRAVYRYNTMKTSFRALKNLTPAEVDAFMNSYVIYGLDWTNKQQMIDTLGPNYMLLYEETIAKGVGLKEGMKCLDYGCGRGRVAAHMATISGANVTGFNIDDNQLAQARQFNDDSNLNNTFLHHDLNDVPLPFPDEHFDAMYQIQCLGSLSQDLDTNFAECYRVLKPGARMAMLDWVSFDSFNPEDPHHAELMRRIKPLIGAIGTPTPKIFEESIKKAGFKVIESKNASMPGYNQSLFIYRVRRWFRGVGVLVRSLVKMGTLPEHFITLMDRLNKDGEAFLEADEKNLVTTSYHILAEKPLNAEANTQQPDTNKGETAPTAGNISAELKSNTEKAPKDPVNEQSASKDTANNAASSDVPTTKVENGQTENGHNTNGHAQNGHTVNDHAENGNGKVENAQSSEQNGSKVNVVNEQINQQDNKNISVN